MLAELRQTRTAARLHAPASRDDGGDDVRLIWILRFLSVHHLTSWNVDRLISTDLISWFNYLVRALLSS